ncbi:hypothetical protein DOTSEDRAFT_39783, partial [Dothistroma septosporum NZE10]
MPGFFESIDQLIDRSSTRHPFRTDPAYIGKLSGSRGTAQVVPQANLLRPVHDQMSYYYRSKHTWEIPQGQRHRIGCPPSKPTPSTARGGCHTSNSLHPAAVQTSRSQQIDCS